MFLNQAPNASRAERGYVPYFYQRGLHYLYPINGDRVPAGRPERAPTVYDFASTDAPFYPVEHRQTVEEIIQHGYLSVPPSDPTMALITDKAQTSWLGLDDVISQVRRRYEIHERILYQIEMSKSSAVMPSISMRPIAARAALIPSSTTPSTRRFRSSMNSSGRSR